MTRPDDDTLREWIAAADPAKPWPGRDAAHDARLEALACAAPSLAAEVLRLRAERDAARTALREAQRAALAARGVRECPECGDVDCCAVCEGAEACGVCDGTGEVPL